MQIFFILIFVWHRLTEGEFLYSRCVREWVYLLVGIWVYFCIVVARQWLRQPKGQVSVVAAMAAFEHSILELVPRHTVECFHWGRNVIPTNSGVCPKCLPSKHASADARELLHRQTNSSLLFTAFLFSPPLHSTLVRFYIWIIFSPRDFVTRHEQERGRIVPTE